MKKRPQKHVLANTLLYLKKKTKNPESYLDNVLLVLEEMS